VLSWYSKICIYFHICAVKTQQTICQIVSLCIIQHYVIYNCMFRPCKRAIIKLFLEPVIGLYNRSMEGGTRSRLTSYFVGLHGFKHLYWRVVVMWKAWWVQKAFHMTTTLQNKCFQPYNPTKYNVRRDLVPHTPIV
jgi:hypothetical protein